MSMFAVLDAHRLPSVTIAGKTLRRWRTGEGRFPTRQVSVWRPDVVRDHNGDVVDETPDGLKLGHYFRVKRLPVGPRIHGGVGFSVDETGRPHYSASFWLSLGWLPMDKLPTGWEEHNQRIEREKLRRAEEEFHKTPLGRYQAAAERQGKSIESLVQVLGQRQEIDPAALAEAVASRVTKTQEGQKTSGGSSKRGS